MSSKPFRFFSVGVLLYTLAVIGWGAFVRATGAGAGCGSHWPVCNGEVIPRDPSVDTLIEYSHRLTSGLALLAVLVLAVWAFRTHPRGHVVRRAALGSSVFMILEAAIGAGLVLLELVALDVSVRRAIAMSLHLVNTFWLLSALGTCVFHAWIGDGRASWDGVVGRLLRSSHLALLFVGASGAVAALGDTLSQKGVGSPLVDTLIRLRIAHPVLAVAAALLVAAAASAAFRAHPLARSWVQGLAVCLVFQLMVGVMNVALKAPVALQLLHLLAADAVWLALVFVSRAALARPSRHSEEAAEPVASAT